MPILQRKTVIHLVTVAAVAFAVFSPSLNGYFLADDFHIVTLLDRERKAIDWANTLSDFYTVFRGEPTYSYYRPMISLSAAIDYTLWGLRPVGFHLTNLALHVANTLLVYAIAAVLQPAQTGPVGLAAALLFALHPLHAEAVYFLAARTDLIATLFILSSFLLYLLFRSNGRVTCYCLSLLAFLAALASKETAVTLPLALALHTVFPAAPAGEGPSETAKVRWLAPYLLLLAGYFVLRKAVTGYVVGQYARPDVEIFRLSATLRGVAKLCAHLLHPIGGELLTPTATALYGNAVTALIPPLGWLLAVASLGLMLVGRWSRRTWFFLGLMLVFAAPLLTLLAATGSPLGEARHYYLPSAAYCLFLGSLLGRVTRLRALLGSAILAAFAALLAVTSLPWIAASGIVWHVVRRIEQAAGDSVKRVIVAGTPDRYVGARLFGQQGWAITVAAAPPFARIPAGVRIIHLPDLKEPLELSSDACRDAGGVALLRWNPVTTRLENVPSTARGCPTKPDHP
jgi:hypothetical protein